MGKHRLGHDLVRDLLVHLEGVPAYLSSGTDSYNGDIPDRDLPSLLSALNFNADPAAARAFVVHGGSVPGVPRPGTGPPPRFELSIQERMNQW